jgi:HEAT repeat protein
MTKRRWYLVLLGFGLILGLLLGLPWTRGLLIGPWNPTREGYTLRGTLELLRTGNDQEREQAAHVLGDFYGLKLPAIVQALTEALSDKNYIVRRNAAESLGKLGPAAQSSGPALIDLLKDPDARVRWRVAHVLPKVEPEPGPAVAGLLPLAQGDKDIPTQTAALFSLGKFGAAAEPAIPVLVESLKISPSKEGDPAGAARTSLQAIGTGSVPFLASACQHDHVRVRAGAAQTLAGMGKLAEPALLSLKNLLEDQDDTVRVQAAAALWKIQGQVQEPVAVLSTILRKSGTEAKGESLVVLGNMGPQAAGAVDALKESLKEKNDALRRIAVQTLGKIGAPARSAMPALEKVEREDADAELRWLAAEVLQTLRKREERK